MNPKARKWLVGSLVGCGVLLLLAVGSCAGFVVWLNTPGDVLEPARLIDPGTTGYVEWTLRLEDPGTEEFFRKLLEAIDTARHEMPIPLPAAIKGPIFKLQSRAGERKLRKMFPVVLVWTLAGGGGDSADTHLWSASLGGADHQLRLMDWMFGHLLGFANDDDHAVRHRGETIMAIPVKGEQVEFFIHHGDLFVATDLGAARRAIDRLEEPVLGVELPARLEPWLAQAPVRPLRGAVDNGEGHLERLWRLMDPGVEGIVDAQTWRALEGLTVGGALEADGSFDAEVDLHFDTADTAARSTAPFAAAWAHLVEGTPLTLVGVEADGPRLRAALEIANVGERLRDGVHDKFGTMKVNP